MLTKESISLETVTHTHTHTHMESRNSLGLVGICKSNIDGKYIELVM